LNRVVVTFFEKDRSDFFRPLTGPWRAVTLDLVCRIYETFFGVGTSSSHFIERDDLRGLARTSIQLVPVMSDEAGPQDDLTGEDEAAKANQLIRRLHKYGWIEVFDDPGTNRDVYRFTRAGKLFAQQIIEYNLPPSRMTQRNVRNTKNALAAYLSAGDPYDLFMALEHSRKVIHDLADDIAEIHERSRQIIARAAKEAALDSFLQYMRERFEPIISIKMRADHVYRHRDEIAEIIEKIKHIPVERRLEMDRAALLLRPASERSTSPQLDTMEEILYNLDTAMRGKMSELAAAVSAYTDRTTFLSLQASISASRAGQDSLNRATDMLFDLPADAQDRVLLHFADSISPFRIALVDESTVRVRKPVVRIDPQPSRDPYVQTRDDLLRATIARARNDAFSLSIHDLRDRLEGKFAELDEGREQFLLSEIEIAGYDDLLFLTHAIESACDTKSGNLIFSCSRLDVRKSNQYIEFDDIVVKVAGRKS
jgi:hypothetical protein